MRVLLIMPRFFEYPEIICKGIRELGYDVDFVDDRPSANCVIKAILKVNKESLAAITLMYFRKILRDTLNKKYDIVFLISGQSLSLDEDMICCLKQHHSEAKFILYQWDSIINFPSICYIYKYFDRLYTFDRADVKREKQLEFLPLFYAPKYEIRNAGLSCHGNYRFDCSFIGTAHPQKYSFINRISNELKSVLPRQFIYYYFASPLVFFYRKLHDKEFQKAKYSEFEYHPMSNEQIVDVFMNSRCILDAPQSGQTGLTIRSIEALGAKKKLITTNADICNYDFFNKANILVFDGSIDKKDAFFTQPYEELPNEIYEKYSLKNWLRTLLQ